MLEFRDKVPSFLRAYLAICALYLASNHWHLLAPVLLPETAVDRAVPFLGWTVWIYVSHFLFLPAAALSVRDPVVYHRQLRALLAAAWISVAFFVAYPTRVPRSIPLPGGPSGAAFELLYWLNTTANCVPSLHVSLVLLAALGLKDDLRPWWPAALLWAGLITLSILTTKEHYAVDAAGGILVAAASRALTAGQGLERLLAPTIGAAPAAGAPPGTR